ncbi:MAG TPA: PEP/pyruvate-binding domain-containing protein [Gammaproteobacteria bacterium]|nr:PEP/pyruvate-binding domain-containing protein [Gammaproteobacteria bacterium]
MNAPDSIHEEMPTVVAIGHSVPSAATARLTAWELGSKAHNLLQMAQAGLSVPPAFVITTKICRAYFEACLPEGFHHDVASGLRQIESVIHRSFGGNRRPLLVSVRSGAPVSMPGMLQTILNVGLNDATIHAFIRTTGNPRLAWDCYRRLIQCYAEAVHDCASQPFEKVIAAHLAEGGIGSERELDAPALRAISQDYLDLFHELTGRHFPQDPEEQLITAIKAVFRSWTSEKAREYRRLNRIDEHMGLAVTVQTMVFGNSGSTSGSGVAFTRNPATGDNQLYVDFLLNAQGEDVVSGRRWIDAREDLDTSLPMVAAELQRVAQTLERHFKDLQDFEFTVERGRLYLLQTRSGQRTPWAALHIAVSLVREGLIDTDTALQRLSCYDIESITRTHLALGNGQSALAQATAASVGIAVGPIAFDVEAAKRLAENNQSPILVREEISTNDIAGVVVCGGILTAMGGRTSHAAVVARQLGKVCLVGCHDLRLDLQNRRAMVGEHALREGDLISLDGDNGRVYAGAVNFVTERPIDALREVERWRTPNNKKDVIS